MKLVKSNKWSQGSSHGFWSIAVETTNKFKTHQTYQLQNENKCVPIKDTK